MIIDVLGTPYIFDETTDTKDARLIGLDGYCDSYAKRIAIETEYNDKDMNIVSNLENLKNKVKRHELVHAMLYESGMREYAENETIVEWIAWQFPKLMKVFGETDCLN